MVKELTANGKIFKRINVFRIENGSNAENWLVFRKRLQKQKIKMEYFKAFFLLYWFKVVFAEM